MSENNIQCAKETKAIDPALDLAVERTQLALERTHLAWIRTMFTLMTAGVAIDKGFAYIHEKRMVSGTAFVNNAHVIGLTLSSVGTILLLFGTIQFIRRNRELVNMKNGKFILVTAAAILSSIVILLGLSLTLLMIITR